MMQQIDDRVSDDSTSQIRPGSATPQWGPCSSKSLELNMKALSLQEPSARFDGSWAQNDRCETPKGYFSIPSMGDLLQGYPSTASMDPTDLAFIAERNPEWATREETILSRQRTPSVEGELAELAEIATMSTGFTSRQYCTPTPDDDEEIWLKITKDEPDKEKVDPPTSVSTSRTQLHALLWARVPEMIEEGQPAVNEVRSTFLPSLLAERSVTV
eukprot:TRINITY_DN93322_c0_g1_i1.p1 TRINITY_DN93322_c0_g1~~TRINITY_DN93322_c0_g1_i1.p1  ORF type:complete len:231 (-),score=25.17 TRINITY_DN93322_c0_g1_i1:16-660(-)